MNDFRLDPADDPPSFLGVLLDVDVVSWQQLLCTEDSSRIADALGAVVEQVLVFINCFLLLHDENRVSIVVFNRNGFRVAFPVCKDPADVAHDVDAVEAENDLFSGIAGTSALDLTPNSIRDSLVSAVQDAIAEQGRALNVTTPCRTSPSLATALCMANRRKNLRSIKVAMEPMPSNPENPDKQEPAKESESKDQARVLALIASPDAPEQYVPMMNCAFAAQQMKVRVDACVLRRDADSTYFQQTAYLTEGVYLRPEKFDADHPEGLLQYLLTSFLPDALSRETLAMPKQQEIDFSASCFATRKRVQEGYTCSVCLSTFEPAVGKGAISCPICHARFASAGAASVRQRR